MVECSMVGVRVGFEKVGTLGWVELGWGLD